LIYTEPVVKELCIRWVAVVRVTDEPQLPLASRWQSCSGTPAIDQAEAARSLGLLDLLNRPPFDPRGAVGVAIR